MPTKLEEVQKSFAPIIFIIAGVLRQHAQAGVVKAPETLLCAEILHALTKVYSSCEIKLV